jgi:pantetheine-phosphate adenylyltransferase
MASTLNPRHAVYAGSFDPVTLGHMDIVQRAARMFDTLTVGVGVNPDKAPLFSPEERVVLLRELVAPYPNVLVSSFTGLTVDFVRQCGSAVMVRGLRTLTDIESEFTMTLANRALAAEIETVFLMASERYSHISSSLIKQIARFAVPQVTGEAQPLGAFVPAPVIPLLRARLGR